MKILDLHIENIRGIKNISLKPDGKNTVIHGPNGSGKSAVVDALDFLFTGNISRLKGRGTREMSLKEHGPHIDHTPKEAVVKATVKIDGFNGPITLERRISNAKKLICSKEIKDVLDVAQRGQYVISRSEILKYIAAESSKRAEEIQALLNLDIIEDLRKDFETIKRDANRKAENESVHYNTSINEINNTIGVDAFNEGIILDKINLLRNVLDGKPLDAIDPEKLQEGITPLVVGESDAIDPELLKKEIDGIKRIVVSDFDDIAKKDAGLKDVLRTLREDQSLMKSRKNKKLLELGISLIDETFSCPLCLKEWKAGELETFLKDRISKAEKAKEYETEIDSLTEAIKTTVLTLSSLIKKVSDSSRKIKEIDTFDQLNQWNERLKKWYDTLDDSENYPIDVETIRKAFFAPNDWENVLKTLENEVEKTEKLTPQQKAWDILTEIKVLLRQYNEQKKKLESAKTTAKLATILSSTYVTVKDSILEGLYSSVNEDFMVYYRFLHGVDEETFFSKLTPQGSSLDFKVDFYGRGTHHPRALHSEGHQDSMGLCLYLALNKKISEDKIKLIVLDDVVMSIDSNHRRGICKLLNQFFPDIQLVITTHNSTWARQLRTDGVVNKENVIEFTGWSVETGPKFETSGDAWKEIREKLDCNVKSAAHLLREHGEFFYENVCDSLKGKILYRSDGRWTLGDYLPGAISAYKEYLRLAKNSAASWQDDSKIKQLTELETIVNEIIKRSNVEQWGINANVHYSKWNDFSKEDFLPVFETFHDLEEIFKCSKCQGILTVNFKDVNAVNVKCLCGNVFWNLEKKAINH